MWLKFATCTRCAVPNQPTNSIFDKPPPGIHLYVCALSLKHFTELTRCIQIYKRLGWLHQHWIEWNWIECQCECLICEIAYLLALVFLFVVVSVATAWLLDGAWWWWRCYCLHCLILLRCLIVALLMKLLLMLLFVTDCVYRKIKTFFLHNTQTVTDRSRSVRQQLCYFFLFLSDSQNNWLYGRRSVGRRSSVQFNTWRTVNVVFSGWLFLYSICVLFTVQVLLFFTFYYLMQHT